MKKIIAGIGIVLMCGVGNACATKANAGLPMINGKEVIATLGDNPIYLDEFTKTLSAMPGHGSGDAIEKTGIIDYTAPLKRLVDTHLILMEAENIGLDDLPDFQKKVQKFSQKARRKFALDMAVAHIEADAAKVAEVYRDDVKEYVVQSLKFRSEEDAQKIAAALEAGGDYEQLAAQAIARGLADGSMETQQLSGKKILPQIGVILAEMDKGTFSPPIPIQDGFVIVRLLDIVYPDKPEVREAATKWVRDQLRYTAKVEYLDQLREKYTTVDKELLEELDLEAEEPGLDALMADKRVVATIDGEAPLTVGELVTAIKDKFFHGTENMMGTGKLNKEKMAGLEKLLRKRLLDREARVQGVGSNESFQGIVNDYRNSLLFGAMVTKVIIPNMTMGEKDIESYYQKHVGDFSSPAMVRLKGLVFSCKDNAETALAKLRGGTDFSWLTSHAEGQVGPDSVGHLRFDGDLLVMTSLPQKLQKQLADVRKGDTTTYADDNGFFYTLVVEDFVAPVPEELAEVREEIKEKVFKIKLQEALDEMTGKLREFYPVKTYEDQLIDMSAVQ